jgi:hypothetical protein
MSAGRRVDAPDAPIAVRELEGIGRHVGFSRTALSVFSFVFVFRFFFVFRLRDERLAREALFSRPSTVGWSGGHE